MKPAKTEKIYTILASVYDELMADIDYELWSDYIDTIIQKYHPSALSILELGCGTGSLALMLDELDCYRIIATDASEAMINRAREKADKIFSDVDFRVLDFRDFTLAEKFDIVLMLFDSINYLLTREDIVSTLLNIRKVLKPGGYFIYDFTTPGNSLRAESLLNEEKTTQNGYWYNRRSHYDSIRKLHYNDFKIRKVDSSEQPSFEQHCQRAYTMNEMIETVNQSGYYIAAAYENFELKPADNNSDRITMVLQ